MLWMAVLVVSSCSTAAPTTGPASFTPDPLDPSDAAFVADLRDRGLAPPVSSTRPDGAYITDAYAICKMMAFTGESPEVKKVDLFNMRKNRAQGYGITEGQATTVMILAVETYCPEFSPTVKRVLGR